MAPLSIVAKRRRPDMQVVALDLKFSDHHRQRLEALGIDVVESLLEGANLTRQFDIIIMNQLIEHLWEPKRGLDVLRQNLAAGGLLSISTPNFDGYDRIYFLSGAWGGVLHTEALESVQSTVVTQVADRQRF